jgi:hypothetical protein
MSTSVIRLVGFLFAGSLMAASADLDTSYQALKDAVSKKDAAQVKQLSVETWGLAHAAAIAPAPEAEAEKDEWKRSVEYAKGVEQYAEYALSSTALASDAATTVDLLSTLEQTNPKSRYLAYAYANYLVALNKTGGAAKVRTVAEKALSNFPDNPDLLMVLADDDMNRRQVQAAGAHAERLVGALRKTAPEGMPAADWERKKAAMSPRAYWICGLAHAEKNEHTLADVDLRLALPLVKGNESMLASTLFYLGVANYHIGRQALDRGRVLEAAKFSEQAAAIRSPFQQQAWTNAHLMRQEAAKMVARR